MFKNNASKQELSGYELLSLRVLREAKKLKQHKGQVKYDALVSAVAGSDRFFAAHTMDVIRSLQRQNRLVVS
jgi:hypothetical protein